VTSLQKLKTQREGAKTQRKSKIQFENPENFAVK
jgi:hypothetical protein